MKHRGALPIYTFSMAALPRRVTYSEPRAHTCDESGTRHLAGAPTPATRGQEAGGQVLAFVTSDVVGSLVSEVAPFLSDTPCWHAVEVLGANPTVHSVPILDVVGQPVGIVNRIRFLDAYRQAADEAAFGAQPIAEYMDASPLVVDAGMSLDDISSIIVEEAGRYIYDGFIVTRGGRYAGVGTGYDLMRALTERRQAHLFHVAHHDVLTGLPNRQLFEDRLRQAIGGVERTERHLAVMLVDVDRFKGVNDTFGHGLGDQLLKSVAGRLAGHVRRGDTVARLNGDEFGVLLLNLNHPDDAIRAARKLLDVMGEPFVLEEQEVRVSCSIGVGVYPTHGQTPETLVRCADAAVVQAKQIRNTFKVYSPEMARPVADRCTYGSLLSAIEDHQLRVFYQPQIDLRSGQVHGVEALVRWQHPEDGLVSGAELVPVAEDTGLISTIFEWLLRTACEQVGRWREMGLGDLRLAVNVSGAQFRQDRLLPAVANIVAAANFEPRRLELEITESVVMRNAPTTLSTLRHLRGMGVSIAIDDFGVGYSSLSYLRRLPVDVLKIDRSFVQEIGEDDGGSAIARTIITLGHSLRLRVVAEGVENSEQLDFLRAHGCDEVQGYLFTAPLALDDLTDWLHNLQRLRRRE